MNSPNSSSNSRKFDQVDKLNSNFRCSNVNATRIWTLKFVSSTNKQTKLNSSSMEQKHAVVFVALICLLLFSLWRVSILSNHILVLQFCACSFITTTIIHRKIIIIFVVEHKIVLFLVRNKTIFCFVLFRDEKRRVLCPRKLWQPKKLTSKQSKTSCFLLFVTQQQQRRVEFAYCECNRSINWLIVVCAIREKNSKIR